MNKKGFTTVELILTIALVIIIMSTITSVTFVYRDRSDYEENVTQIATYKNTLTKIIYDDILDLNDPVVSIKKDDNFYTLTTKNNKTIPLKIIEEDDKVGILYNNMEYIIPGSNDGSIELQNVKLQTDDVNKIYVLDITFNSLITDPFTIHFMVS